MFEKLEIFRMAGAMAQHATARQSVIAENIAQADTPGYKARDVAPFAQTYKADDSQQMRKTRAGHLLGESSSAPMMAPCFRKYRKSGYARISQKNRLIRGCDQRRATHGRSADRSGKT